MVMPRSDAATILKKVADTTEHGSFPDDVTPFHLGRALYRTLPNCPRDDLDAMIGEFLRGFFNRPQS